MSAAPTNPAQALTAPEAELLARRREIAETGIAIADEQGIDAVSMRNIATRLGVGTMTLYTWVESKDDLISVMADALADQMLVPEPMTEDWREALTQIAVATRNVFTDHPWMLSGRPPGRIGANMLRHVDQSLRAVRGLELDWERRASILQAVDHYAIGYAVANQRRAERIKAHRERDAKDSEAKNYGAAFEKVSEARAHKARTEIVTTRSQEANAIELRAMFESGAAPGLVEIFGTPEKALERIRQGPPKVENDFDDGLRWMLDGIAAMFEDAAER